MNWEIPLFDQFIGIFILSFISFLIILGIIYTYFATKSTRIDGIIIISIGGILTLVLFIVGEYVIEKGERIPWWNIFKIEAIFADLGALLGLMAVLCLLMIVIIQTDRKH
jgi:uncharacterized BrkB/YihY/UPF0761 family membrane protein